MAEETKNESCNYPIKKHISRKRPATEQMPGTPSATEHIAPETDAATEHIAPASLGSTYEASPGSGGMMIESLADVVSKLAHECEESAVALCSAARTLQRGVRADVWKLCKPWGVQLGRSINGKYSKRRLYVLKSELTATYIETAREHFRTKATEAEQLQHAATENASAMQLERETEAPAGGAATEHTKTELQAPVRNYAHSDIRRWMPKLKMNQISILDTPAPKKTKYADIASFVVKAPLI